MKLSKLFNAQKSKLFWLYIVVGFLFVVAGVMLAPFWVNVNEELFFAKWGYSVLNFIIAMLIFLYIGFYLVKKIVQDNGNSVVKVLTIIEALLLLFIGISAVLTQFGIDIVYLNNAGQILGLALWLRGTVEVFRAYYFRSSDEVKYPVWWLAVAIVFITLGVALFVKNFLSNEAILWLVVGVLALIGIISIIVGFVKKPATVKKEKKAKPEKKTEEKKDDDKKDNDKKDDDKKEDEKK